MPSTIAGTRAISETAEEDVLLPLADKLTFFEGRSKRKHIVILLSLILLVAVSVGCSRHPNDEQIQKDIQTKAAADPETKDAPITVSAKEGRVTLIGKVRSEAAGKKLKKIAQEEPGVAEVDDETSIDESLLPQRR